MLAAGFSENFANSLTGVRNFFLTGGWFMVPLVVCWFVSVTVIVWKCLDLRRRHILPDQLANDLENVDALLAAGRFGALQQALRSDDSLLARLCRLALSDRHPDKEAAVRATEAAAREQVSQLERGIPVLEIIFTVAPMLGLIGTVSGLVTIFSAFGEAAQSAAQARAIALGIAEAMNTTIAGLVVAVPSLIAQVLFTRQVEKYALRLGVLVNGLLDACQRHFQVEEAAVPASPAYPSFADQAAARSLPVEE